MTDNSPGKERGLIARAALGFIVALKGAAVWLGPHLFALAGKLVAGLRKMLAAGMTRLKEARVKRTDST